MFGSVLSFGVYKPGDDDTGDVWFPQMSNNMQYLNDHNHDGKTKGNLIAVTLQQILNTNWGTPNNGTYQQNMTLPAPFNYDSCQIEFRTSSGTVLYPTILRVSPSVYTIFTNDNTQNYVAIYR